MVPTARLELARSLQPTDSKSVMFSNFIMQACTHTFWRSMLNLFLVLPAVVETALSHYKWLVLTIKLREHVAVLDRLELPTHGLGNHCSIHLSYRTIFFGGESGIRTHGFGHCNLSFPLRYTSTNCCPEYQLNSYIFMYNLDVTGVLYCLVCHSPNDDIGFLEANDVTILFKLLHLIH